jgi:hypothetical protein
MLMDGFSGCRFENARFTTLYAVRYIMNRVSSPFKHEINAINARPSAPISGLRLCK